MDAKKIVTQAFIDQWLFLGGNYQSLNLDQIERVFNLNGVQLAVDISIMYAFNKESKERYHIQNLRKLAQNYAKILFQNSEHGTLLNEAKMFSAKNEMKRKSSCDIYPC